MGKALNTPIHSAWSPDGRWLASLGKPIKGQSLESPDQPALNPNRHALLLSEVIHPVTGLRTHEKVERLEFSPDGSQLSVNRTLVQTRKDDRGCRLIPLADEGGGVIRYAGKDQRFRIERYQQDTGGFVFRVDLMAPRRERTYLKHPGFTEPPFFVQGKTTVPRPKAFALSPDGKQLVALFFLDRREDHPKDARNLGEIRYVNSLESWDVGRGQLAIWNVDSPEEHFASIDFILGGERVVTTSDQGVKVWDPKTGQVLQRFALARQPNVSWSSSGTREKGWVQAEWTFSLQPPLILSPGGDYALLLAREDSYDLISWRDGKKLGAVPSPLHNLGPKALSPDGRVVARIHLLSDERTGKWLEWHLPVRPLVTALAFHPDGDVIAVGDETGLVRLWHLGWIKAEAEKIGIPLPVLK